MKARNVRDWLLTLVVALALVWTLWGMLVWAHDATASRPVPTQPGPEWQHDHGSIWWTCTSSGRALIRDTDTGTTFLDRDDRKCDSGG